MTTIAYRDGIIAADSQQSWDSHKTKCEKLFRATDGSVIGTSGDTFSSMMFVDWYNNKRRTKPDLTLIDIEEDFLCIILKKDGLWTVNKFFHMVKDRNEQDMLAIGSGAAAAMAAMLMGASAEKAVEIACKVDLYTGGDIKVMKYKRPRKR